MSTATLAIRLTLEGAGAAGQAIKGLAGAVQATGHGFAQANQFLFFFLNNLKSVAGFAGKIGHGIFDNLLAPNIKFEEQVIALARFVGSAEEAEKKLEKIGQSARKVGLTKDDAVNMYLIAERMKTAGITTDEAFMLAGKAAKYLGKEGTAAMQDIQELMFMIASGHSMDRQALSLGREGLISPEQFKELGKKTELLGKVGDATKNLAELEKDYAHMSQANSHSTHAERYEQLQQIRRAKDELQFAQQDTGGMSVAGVQRDAADMIAKTTQNVKTQTASWTRLTRELHDFWNEAREIAGRALFENVKKDLQDLTKFLEQHETELMQWSKQAGEAVASAWKQIKKGSVFGLKAEDIFNSNEAGVLGQVLWNAIKDTALDFGNLLLYGIQKFGPEIQKTITPPGLRDFLGVNAVEAARDLHAGKISEQEAWDKMGIWNRMDATQFMAEDLKIPGAKFMPSILQEILLGTRARHDEASGSFSRYIDTLEKPLEFPKMHDVRAETADIIAEGRRRKMADMWSASFQEKMPGGDYMNSLRSAVQTYSAQLANSPLNPLQKMAAWKNMEERTQKLADNMGEAGVQLEKLLDAILKSQAYFQ